MIQHRHLFQAFRDGLLLRAAVYLNGHHLFVGNLTLDDLPVRFVHDECVRGNRSSHNSLAESPGGVNHDLVALSIDRIGGEQDPGSFRRHQQLHDNRQGDLVWINALARPVTDGTRSPERGPAFLDCIQNSCRTVDIQIGFLLAGKGGLRQVFGGSG